MLEYNAVALHCRSADSLWPGSVCVLTVSEALFLAVRESEGDTHTHTHKQSPEEL